MRSYSIPYDETKSCPTADGGVFTEDLAPRPVGFWWSGRRFTASRGDYTVKFFIGGVADT
jgi:hypothetical protein